MNSRCRTGIGTVAWLGMLILSGCTSKVELVSPRPVPAGANTRLYDHATRQRRNAPPVRQPSAREYFERGKTHEDQKDDDRAIKAYTRAITADPQSTEARYRRALIYQRQELWPAAIMDLDHVIRTSPGFINARYTRGVAYARLGKHEQAIEDLSEVVAGTPQNPRGYQERGQSYMAVQDFDRALEDFDKALSLIPDDASGDSDRGLIHHWKGLNHHWKGHYNSAVLDYTRALIYNTNLVANYVNRCWALALLARAEKAREDCDKAAALDPVSPHAHDASAFVLWQLGDKDGAIAALTKARSLDKDFMIPQERYREFPIYLTKSLLKAAGYDPGTVDEKVDQRTRAAIRRFQGDRKLTVTGEISADLLSELRKTKTARYLYETPTPSN